MKVSLFFICLIALNLEAQVKPLNAKGIKIHTIKESVDTSIRVNPRMVYLSYEIEGMSNVTLAEVMAGTESFVVTDEKGMVIPVKDKLLHSVKSALGTNTVNYIVKIPFKLKAEQGKRKIYFKWLGPDKTKVLELTAIR